MNPSNYINRMKAEYGKGTLDEKQVQSSPFSQFREWFDVAMAHAQEEANACALATTGTDLQPRARMVLLKSYDEHGFVFFTNYNSEKGHQLAENPKASLLFYWSSIERQVRIDGVVTRVSDAESDEYFHSRPRDSQFGSAVSRQSESATSREIIEQAVAELRAKVGDGVVPRPAHWGGYRLKPVAFEFWQGREDRLHDRVRYLREGDSWKIERLWP